MKPLLIHIRHAIKAHKAEQAALDQALKEVKSVLKVGAVALGHVPGVGYCVVAYLDDELRYLPVYAFSRLVKDGSVDVEEFKREAVPRDCLGS